MFDLPTCVSCPSASDEGWMYTVLKNQKFELMLSLASGSYSFSAAIQSCFFKIHISLIPVRLYMTDDKFDTFPSMADKIRVRKEYRQVLLCSQMMKR